MASLNVPSLGENVGQIVCNNSALHHPRLLGAQIEKKLTLAVWETGVSRHNGGTINGPH